MSDWKTRERYPMTANYRFSGLGIVFVNPENKEESRELWVPDPPDWGHIEFMIWVLNNYIEKDDAGKWGEMMETLESLKLPKTDDKTKEDTSIC